MADTFYRDFSDRQKTVTDFGRARRGRTERSRLGLLMRHARPPGDMLEIGPGKGSLALAAVDAGWRYRAMEASPILITELRALGLDVIEGWAPPILTGDATADVVYADQVLYDGGFHIDRVVRSIGAATGVKRDLLAAGAIFTNVPGLDTLSRYTGTEDLLFRVRKNLFETLEFVATKPAS
jgi:hypothetical protein